MTSRMITKRETIRVLMARGASDDQIMRQEHIQRRQLERYKDRIRRDNIKAMEHKEIRDLFYKFVDEVTEDIRAAYLSLQDDKGEPSALLKVIVDARTRILEYGIKLGILPGVTEKVEVTLDKEVEAVVKVIAETADPRALPELLKKLKTMQETQKANM